MDVFSAVVAALVVDSLLGEPKRYHPLVGFGWIAEHCERLLYRSCADAPNSQYISGLIAVLLCVAPWLGLGILLQWQIGGIAQWLASVTSLYMAIGHTSLRHHAKSVAKALYANDLETARRATAYIVSRDTTDVDESALSIATVESVLENGNDAVFAAIFWFALAGIPGVIGYRLVNTLDAMWGYKTARYLYFGRAAAKLDDALNWLPARLSALTYSLVGQTGKALHCWQQQGRNWKSPNAGPVMAAGAGALNVKLGGTVCYHGKAQQRPTLGCGEAPKARHIEKALQLVLYSTIIWVVVIAALDFALR